MKSQASFYAAMFFVIGAGGMICCALSQWGFGTLGARLGARLRVKLFEAMLHQEVGGGRQVMRGR